MYAQAGLRELRFGELLRDLVFERGALGGLLEEGAEGLILGSARDLSEDLAVVLASRLAIRKVDLGENEMARAAQSVARLLKEGQLVVVGDVVVGERCEDDIELSGDDGGQDVLAAGREPAALELPLGGDLQKLAIDVDDQPVVEMDQLVDLLELQSRAAAEVRDGDGLERGNVLYRSLKGCLEGQSIVVAQKLQTIIGIRMSAVEIDFIVLRHEISSYDRT